MTQKWYQKASVQTAIVAGIFALGVAALQMFSSKNPSSTSWKSTRQLTPLENDFFVEELEKKIKSFKLIGDGNKIVVKYVSDQYGFEMTFEVPENFSLYTVKTTIIHHFEFGNNIEISGGSLIDWIVFLNNHEVSNDRLTLKEIGFKNGDVINIGYTIRHRMAFPSPRNPNPELYLTHHIPNTIAEVYIDGRYVDVLGPNSPLLPVALVNGMYEVKLKYGDKARYEFVARKAIIVNDKSLLLSFHQSDFKKYQRYYPESDEQ